MKIIIRIFFCCFLTVLAFCSNAQSGFVTVKGQQFFISGKPYKFIGANYWYGGLLATNGKAGKERLIKELNFLQKEGVTNLRVMVGAEGQSAYPYRSPAEKSVQPEAGKFNENILKGLDYLLCELGKRNMKAVLHFTNTWEWSGGLGEYLKWNGYGEQPYPKNANYTWEAHQQYISKFYNCEACQIQLDNYIKYILNRKNSITGNPYVNDNAIMAWEIINEPRAMSISVVPAFKKWMQHTAYLIKSIDTNHLLTTGSEGDVASNNDMGVYSDVHNDPNIDYLTIHIWPKNWGWFKDTAIVSAFDTITNKAVTYTKRHLKIAQQLNKPLVIEEFGLPRDSQSFDITSHTTSRDKFYQLIINLLQNNAGLAGCNFWAFGGLAKPIHGQVFWKKGDEFMGDPGGEEQGLNSVFISDLSTWNILNKQLK